MDTDDSIILDAPGPLMRGRKLPFITDEALKILSTTDHTKCCSAIPTKPRGEAQIVTAVE